MVGWGTVASRTVRAADGGMIEGGVFEVICVTVAGIARTRKMIDWGTVTG